MTTPTVTRNQLEFQEVLNEVYAATQGRVFYAIAYRKEDGKPHLIYRQYDHDTDIQVRNINLNSTTCNLLEFTFHYANIVRGVNTGIKNTTIIEWQKDKIANYTLIWEA